MSFRRKTYPEVAESLLNRLLGGVSGEAHPYPPPKAAREPYRHPLERTPVASITSVYGSRNGESYRFERGADYELSPDGAQLAWKKDGARPDAGSVFEVHYLPKSRETLANDLYPGSVVRTLLEATALETAALYAQLEVVYRSAFVDTADGGALDHVVGLLGVVRVRAGRNSTELRFTRAKNTRGEIFIPAGTRVLTAKGEIEYETLDDLTLTDGQPTGKVTARDLVATNDGLPADSLTLLAKPIAGIESVANPAATTRLDRDESDDELRGRARHFLAGSERGTPGAIAAAVAAQGLKCEVEEPEDSPGEVLVRIQEGALDAERRARLEAAVNAVRPAGIRLTYDYGAAPVNVDLDLRLTTASGLLETDLRRIQEAIRKGYADYFERLPATADGSITKLVGVAMGIDGVEDIKLLRAQAGGASVLNAAEGLLQLKGNPTRLGAFTVTDPALATGVTLVVRYTRDVAIPDAAKLKPALEETLAYLNELAAKADPADAPKRSLSWGKLTRALPLPITGWTATARKAQDEGSGSPASAAAIASYAVQWVFTRPTGASTVLDSEAAPSFALTTEERLSVARVAAEVQPKGGA